MSGVECHCAACHRHFGGIYAFDMHRVKDACADPAELRKKNGRSRLMSVERKSGLVWVQAVLPSFKGSKSG